MQPIDTIPVQIDNRRPPTPSEKQEALAASHPAFSAGELARARAEGMVAMYESLRNAAVMQVMSTFNVGVADTRRILGIQD